MLWYVAYGSNLAAARFRCYLTGGRAAGARRANPGARDPSPPADDRRVELGHPLLFGGPSPTWDGGTAYLDIERDPSDGSGAPPGIGRAWRITHEQFEDLLAQEHGREPGAVTLDRSDVTDGGVVLDDRYGRLVPLPPVDGEPAVTFSYVERPTPRDPDPLYVEQLRVGLRELGVGDDEADVALGRQAGLVAARGWTADEAGELEVDAPPGTAGPARGHHA